MHDVFISYSHKDAQTADAICHHLEEEGIRCWYAPRNIEVGVEWPDAIVKAIETCSVMVLIFTNDSNDSRQVRREVDQALNAGKTIIPFKRTDSEPSGSMRYYLSTLHWLDAMDKPLERSIEDLAGRIQALLGREEEQEDRQPAAQASEPVSAQVSEEPAPKAPPKLIIGIAAAVLALVIGVVALGGGGGTSSDTGGTESAAQTQQTDAQDAEETRSEDASENTSSSEGATDAQGDTSTTTTTNAGGGGAEDNYLYTIQSDNEVQLDRYFGPETAELVIPPTIEGLPVTMIGEKCFEDCEWIEKLVLPDGLEHIYYRAFYGCSNLKEMNIPSSLKHFSGWSFAHCGFTEMILPDTFENLDYGAFYGNSDLVTVVLPEAVDYIGENTFRLCASLQSVTIPAANPEINAKAFEPESGVTIIGVAGSYTEKYAKGMGLTFQAL